SVRGLRFIEMAGPAGGGRYPGTIGVEAFFELAPRMRELGWHAEMWARCADLARLLPRLADEGMPIVVDHFAMVETDAGVEHPDFQQLLAYLREGGAWLKLAL